eukprot:8165154-Pyramimonas_sp.AAC.1
MEVWHAELQEERELLEATPPEDLFVIPTQMVSRHGSAMNAFICRRAKASQLRTSRYMHKLKFVKNEKGEMESTIRLRLVLRGFMDLEAFDVETFSGTTRRSSQRVPASTAARRMQWIIVSLDISMAFLKGLAYQELAEATGGKERVACFTLPPGSATVLRTLRIRAPWWVTAYSSSNQAQAPKTPHGLSHSSSGGPPEGSVSDPRPTTRSSRRGTTWSRPSMLTTSIWPALRTPKTSMSNVLKMFM